VLLIGGLARVEAQAPPSIAEGRRLLDLGQPEQAIALLESARASWTEASEQGEAVRVLGLAYMLAGRAAEAVPHLQAALAANASPDVAHVLAQAAVQTRQPDTVRLALAVAFGLPSTAAEVQVAAGQLMARMDMHEMADVELRGALTRAPTVLQANYLLGQQALFRGRLDEAIDLTRRELALNPLDSMAMVQLGDALGRQARWDEAAPVLQRSIWLNPYYSAPYILLARGYLATSQADLAEGMAQRALSFDPNNRSAHYLHGQILQRLGRADAAKAAFARAEALQDQGRR